MNAKSVAALMSRGIGLILVIIGFTSLFNLPVFEPSGLATSGWTSYSPLGTNQTVPTMSPGFTGQWQDTYFLIASNPSLLLPSALQLLSGLALMWWSQIVGGWLARGLEREDEREL